MNAPVAAKVTESSPACPGVTLRVVILALVLSVAFGYALPVIDYKLNNTFLGGSHLPPGAVGVLLVLILVVNPLLKLLAKRWRLSRNEVLTVYITCLFSCLISGHGSENFIIPNLLAPFYFATPENGWMESLSPFKSWLTPALNPGGGLNPLAYEGWYGGLRADQAIPWGAWTLPLAFWISVVLVSYWMLGCLSVMLNAQWSEREALAFPLLRLPVEMTEDMDAPDMRGAAGGFFRNPLTWAGFGAAVFVQLLRGLHLYFPDVPDFPLGLNTGPLFTEAPWNQIGWVPLNIYPMVVGITYLLTAEISFSLWFFYWFIKFQYIAAYFLGYPSSTLPGAGGFPDKLFTGNQIGGCYIAYVAIVLWTAREHLKHVWQRALGRIPAGISERDQGISYPLAFWGFTGGFGFLVGTSCLAGVRLDVALALWITYLIFAIGLTRVAVEGGLLALQHGTMPLGAIARLLDNGPSRWLTVSSGIAPASLFQTGMVYHMRAFVMPSFVHGFKLAHDYKIAMRRLLVLLSAVILISVLVSWHTVVRLGYENGALSFGHLWWTQAGARSPVAFMDMIMKGDNRADASTSWLWLITGGALTYGMMLARSRFTFFPFHPIGYLMALSYPAATFWISIFLAWLAKVLITRFGGNDSYRKAIPLFLGLVLGDVLMILFWLVIDGWQGRVGHLLLPG